MKGSRSLFAVLIAVVMTWNSFATPAFAAGGIGEWLGSGFWQALGGVVGGATGTVVTCYAVDVAIAPFAPPVAAYLAPMCGTIGAVVGGGTGAASVGAILNPA